MKYLNPTYYLNYEHEHVQQIVAEFKISKWDARDKAIGLYLKIRDGWRYNPYRISFERDDYRASNIALKSEGHCIEKAILLTAGLRALDIPARLQLAKVKNHIGVERLIEKFGSNELTPHGMVNLCLDGKWLKVSPAFNKELCQKCQVAPLDFDGENDSVFQEYDQEGNTFMEYLEDYGSFEDVPMEFIFENFKGHYPDIFRTYEGRSRIEL